MAFIGTNCLQADREQLQWMYKNRKKRLRSQGCIFSLDLVSLDSKTILRELEDLPGFIISTHNLNIDDTDLMANSQSKRTLLHDSKGKQKEKTNWRKNVGCQQNR